VQELHVFFSLIWTLWTGCSVVQCGDLFMHSR